MEADRRDKILNYLESNPSCYIESLGSYIEESLQLTYLDAGFMLSGNRIL